jgi:ABC-type uncharacterized transport system permease subunit
VLDFIIAFRGSIANVIGVTVWAFVVFASHWSLWVSVPVGFVASTIAAIAWGCVVGALRIRRGDFWTT